MSSLFSLCSGPCRISHIYLLSKDRSLLCIRVLPAAGYSWSCRTIQRGSKPGMCWSFLFSDVKELYYFALSLLETSLSMSNCSKLLKSGGVFFPCLCLCGHYDSIQKERSFSSTENHLYGTRFCLAFQLLHFYCCLWKDKKGPYVKIKKKNQRKY